MSIHSERNCCRPEVASIQASHQEKATNTPNTAIAKTLPEEAFQDALLDKYVIIASQVMELEKEVSSLSQDEMQDLTRFWKQEVRGIL